MLNEWRFYVEFLSSLNNAFWVTILLIMCKNTSLHAHPSLIEMADSPSCWLPSCCRISLVTAHLLVVVRLAAAHDVWFRDLWIWWSWFPAWDGWDCSDWAEIVSISCVLGAVLYWWVEFAIRIFSNYYDNLVLHAQNLHRTSMVDSVIGEKL